MKKDHRLNVSILSPCWQVLRMVFVVVSLYLLGIAFHSWDGYKYYGSLPDFLSGIALVFILWGLLAVILTIVILLLFKVIEWSCLRLGRKIAIEQILIFIVGLILSGGLFSKGRDLILHFVNNDIIKNKIKLALLRYGMETNQLSIMAILVAAATLIAAAILFTRLLQDKGILWIRIIQGANNAVSLALWNMYYPFGRLNFL